MVSGACVLAARMDDKMATPPAPTTRAAPSGVRDRLVRAAHTCGDRQGVTHTRVFVMIRRYCSLQTQTHNIRKLHEERTNHVWETRAPDRGIAIYTAGSANRLQKKARQVGTLRLRPAPVSRAPQRRLSDAPGSHLPTAGPAQHTHTHTTLSLTHAWDRKQTNKGGASSCIRDEQGARVQASTHTRAHYNNSSAYAPAALRWR